MKRILSVLVITGLIAGLLSGCLAPPPEPVANTATPTPTTTATEPTAEPDTNSSASPKESSDPQDVINGLSANGYWIFSLLDDVTLNETLYVDGVFYNRDDTSGKVFRKLALNTQDASYTVIDRFTLTVPEMIITSPNFLVQNGTIKGNVHVNAEGLTLTGVDIVGTLTFETQEQMDSANLDKIGTVSGGISVVSGAEPVAEPEPEPEPEPEAPAEEEPTTPTTTATPAPTATPTPKASSTPAPTAAPTPAPTAAPTPAPTAAPTPAPTPDAGSEATSEATG